MISCFTYQQYRWRQSPVSTVIDWLHSTNKGRQLVIRKIPSSPLPTAGLFYLIILLNCNNFESMVHSLQCFTLNANRIILNRSSLVRYSITSTSMRVGRDTYQIKVHIHTSDNQLAFGSHQLGLIWIILIDLEWVCISAREYNMTVNITVS